MIWPYRSCVLPDTAGDDHRGEPQLAARSGQDDEAAGVLQRLTRRVRGVRSWVLRRPGGARIWRAGVAVIGLLVVLVGIVLLVVPGPGWVVIFVGIGIWATEFAWAKSLLTFVQRKVKEFTTWVGRQPRGLTVAIVGAAVVIVGAIAWLALR